jgi:hypothetical protein
MVNSMEEFWKDPELTFHQVKNMLKKINLGVMVLKLLKRNVSQFFKRIR